jgi:hypothetical protein
MSCARSKVCWSTIARNAPGFVNRDRKTKNYEKMTKITKALRGRRGAQEGLPKIAAQGLKEGALPKFMEDAVKWRLFDQTIIEVHEAFADMPMADKLENLIDEAVASARKERRRERKRRSR